MFKGTSYFRELCLNTTKVFIFSVLSLTLVSILSLGLGGNNKASALTSSTINYQARLLQSNGAIAPDGNYNVDFKLYSTLSTGGGQAVGTCTSTGGYTCLWEETYTSGNVVAVKDGYLTVNLGSITSFPSTINWGNQLYLTMNIGGTGGSPTWDGEMTPRIQLTSVPYAFESNLALTADTLTDISGAYTDTLQLTAPSGTSNTITVPDATGTVCLQGSATTADDCAIGSGSAILQGGNSFGTTVTIGSTTAYGINLITSGATVASLSSTGAATFQNSANSATAFQIENLLGNALLDIDTNGSNVNVGSTGALSLATTVNINTTSAGGQTTNIGNNVGASALNLYTGTGNFALNGAATSIYTIGAATTTGTITIGGTAQTGAGTLTVGSSTASNTENIGTGNGATTLNLGTGTGANVIQIGSTTSSSGTQAISIGNNATAGSTTNLTIGSTVAGTFSLQDATTISLNTPTAQFTALAAGTRTLNVATQGTNVAGSGLTIQAGAAGTGASAFTGGTLLLQGGNAGGTGNANGANVALQGGAGDGSGVQGLVTHTATAFLSVAYSTGSSATITQADIDNDSTIEATATAASLTLTVPSPTITTAGRILYISNAGATNAFTVAATGITSFVLAPATSGTLQWNGSAWTSASNDAAGAFIQNQNATTQTANFKINGTGQAAAFDAAAAGVLNVGITTATSLQIGSSTNTTSGVTISTAAGLTLNGVASSTYNIGAATTTGNITIGGTGQTTGIITLGSSTATSTVLIANGSGISTVTIANGVGGNTVNINNGAGTNATNIGTAASVNTIIIGSTNSTSSLLLQAGTGNLQIQSQGGTLGVGNNAVAQTLAIGNSTGATAVSITSGTGNVSIGTGTSTGNITFTTNNASSSIIAKSSTNTATAFQVENTGSASILAVDTSNSRVVLGNQTANVGTLAFDDGANSNVIQLSAGGATAAYNLILPLSTPTSNLCLESGPSATPGQLQFTSCYNTTPTISTVAGGSWSGTATSGTTVTGGTLNAVAPTTIGDLMIVTTSLPATAGSVTGISGGGVTTWSLATANAAVGSALRVETWFGVVTATGTHALTLTHSGTLSSGTAEVNVTEFTAAGITSSSTWGVDTSGVASSASNTSTLSMANLAPGQTGELYYGFANDQSAGLGSGGSCPNVPSAGTTWTCTTSAGGQSNVVDYDLSVTAGTAGGYNGKALLGSSSVNYNSVATLFTAFISSSAINNSVSTQLGNFNVQAADTVSVAGVLQAGVGSSQDIFDIKNSSGVNVDTFGSTGNVVFAPSTVSTTAFQVETPGGAASVVTVDTSNDKLILNSTVSGTSALQFTQLTSASAASSSFSQLLGVDSSGNVGLSTAGVALTSPALAYWDGLNDPTVTGQSYPLATITGSHTSYSSGNGEQLTDTTTTNESGSINWNFSQVPFEEIQFQFKAGGGTGADSTWFYGYANATPTTEYGTGLSQGYIIYFSEYHGCIGIAWVSFTDGNQCASGGGVNPLASVAEANIGNNAWHNVDIEINYNVITVRWDGAVVLTYSDIYTRNTSDLNFGFGSRTGSNTNNHYIKGLVVTKLGSVAGDFGIDTTSPIIGTLNWNSASSSLLATNSNINFQNVAAPGALTIGSTSGSSGPNGTYYYVVTYVTAQGQTNYGTVSSSITTGGAKNIHLTNIPLGTPGIVTGRSIYRTVAGGLSTGPFYLVTTIADNTTTTYTDTTVDGSLGAAAPAINTTDGSGLLQVNGSSVLTVDTVNQNVSIGSLALANNTGGLGNFAIGTGTLEANTTGDYNYALGANALVVNTTGSNNVALGVNDLELNTTGAGNIAIGDYTGTALTTGNSNILIGYNITGTAGTSNVLDIGGVVQGNTSTGSALFQNASNSATAFVVETLGSVSLLTVNTTADDVIIGSGSGGNTTGYPLVLDTKTSAIADPTYIQGAMYYNATSNTFRCGVNGAWQDCAVGFDSANTTTTTVNGNTTGLQTLASSSTIPANYCTAGRDIDILANGIYSTTTTAQPISFTIQLGSTTIGVSSTAFTPAINLTNAAWTLQFQIICNAAPGASVAVTGEGYATIFPGTSTNTTALEVLPMETTTTTTTTGIATNGTLVTNLGVTFTGTPSTLNKVQYNQFIVRAE